MDVTILNWPRLLHFVNNVGGTKRKFGGAKSNHCRNKCVNLCTLLNDCAEKKEVKTRCLSFLFVGD